MNFSNGFRSGFKMGKSAFTMNNKTMKGFFTYDTKMKMSMLSSNSFKGMSLTMNLLNKIKVADFSSVTKGGITGCGLPTDGAIGVSEILGEKTTTGSVEEMIEVLNEVTGVEMNCYENIWYTILILIIILIHNSLLKSVNQTHLTQSTSLHLSKPLRIGTKIREKL